MAKKLEIERNAIENALMACKDFVKHHKSPVLLTFVVLLVAIISSISFVVYYNSKSEGSLVAYEKIIDQYQESISKLKEPADKDKEIEKTIESLKKLSKENAWGYVNSHIDYVIAGFYFKLKKYTEAKKLYLSYAESNSQDLAQFAYLQAAVCEENLGNFDKALEIYKKLDKDYEKSDYKDVIYYGLGRMYQEKSDLANAKEYFNKIIKEISSSALTGKAKERLFALSFKK